MVTERTSETHDIQMTIAGNSVQMDYRSLTDAMLTELADEIVKDPNVWLDKFRDIVALQQAESRGFKVEGTSVSEVLDDVYGIIGHPVLTMTPAQASNHGKRTSDLAYESMTPSDRATRDAFAERKAAKAQHQTPPATMQQVHPLAATGTPIHDAMQAGQRDG